LFHKLAISIYSFQIFNIFILLCDFIRVYKWCNIYQ